jgi:hypothetical protein
MAEANSTSQWSGAKIPILTKENWFEWKGKMKSLLVKEKLWKHVSGQVVKFDKDDQVWLDKDESAVASFYLSVDQHHICYLDGAKTSNEIWINLHGVYEPNTLGSRNWLNKMLHRQIYIPGTPIRDYINRTLVFAARARAVGYEINDEALCGVLMGELPEEFSQTLHMLGLVNRILDTKFLTEQLCEHERREMELKQSGNEIALYAAQQNRKPFSNDSTPQHESAQLRKPQQQPKKKKSGGRGGNKGGGNPPKPSGGSGSGGTRLCYVCGSPGHMADKCPNKFKPPTGQGRVENLKLVTEDPAPRESIFYASASTAATTSPTWFMDSGASSHMCNLRELFVDIQVYSAPVHLADDHVSMATGMGPVKLQLDLPGIGASLMHLSKVLHVPDLKSNLISLSKLTDMGAEIHLVGDMLLVHMKEGELACRGRKAAGQYQLLD